MLCKVIVCILYSVHKYSCYLFGQKTVLVIDTVSREKKKRRQLLLTIESHRNGWSRDLIKTGISLT